MEMMLVTQRLQVQQAIKNQEYQQSQQCRIREVLGLTHV